MIKSETEKNRTLEILSGIKKNQNHILIALNESGIDDAQTKELILGQTSAISIDLENQLALYEALKNGDVTPLKTLTPGQKLIAMRILKGMSQSEVAARLKVTQASVNKDERNEYSGASFEKLTRVAAAMGCQIEVNFHEISMNPHKPRRNRKDRHVG
jgi:DNA-binding XRE family transcriptional regulator